jgi:hypothetical protein
VGVRKLRLRVVLVDWKGARVKASCAEVASFTGVFFWLLLEEGREEEGREKHI